MKVTQLRRSSVNSWRPPSQKAGTKSSAKGKAMDEGSPVKVRAQASQRQDAWGWVQSIQGHHCMLCGPLSLLINEWVYDGALDILHNNETRSSTFFQVYPNSQESDCTLFILKQSFYQGVLLIPKMLSFLKPHLDVLLQTARKINTCSSFKKNKIESS